jgi:hypothetical protein
LGLGAPFDKERAFMPKIDLKRMWTQLKAFPKNSYVWLKSRTLEGKDVATGMRNAGSLMLGNSVVLPLLTSGPVHHWLTVMGIGILLVVAFSIKEKK